jgi:hypothetical protein
MDLERSIELYTQLADIHRELEENDDFVGLPITITIEGPSGVINPAMHIVEHLFKMLENNVEVINSRADRKTVNRGTITLGKHDIKLIAKHQPWGG